MTRKKYKSKRFLLPILSLVLISIISIASINSYITISMFKKHMNEHIEETKKEYTKKHKEKAYETVKLVSDTIDFEITTIEKKLKESLKDKINTAINITNIIYEKYKYTHSKEELKKKISEALASVKFNNKRDYYFMYDNKTKIIFGHPMKKFINKNMTNFRDRKGRNIMQTDAEILKKKKIGFNKIYFNKLNNQNEQFPKITCITKFEPLDIVIGIGEYLDVIEEETKKHILNRFSQNKFNYADKYIVILNVHNMQGGKDFATVLLNSNRPELVGRKVNSLDKDIKGNKFRQDFLDLVKHHGEGYSTYWYKKPTTKVPAKKISYFILQKEWNWIIASGFYYENLEKQIGLMQESTTEYTNNIIETTLIWVLILSLIAILIAILVSIRIDRTIKEYTKTIIDYKDNKRKQEHMLIQQSKMAAMGEMLGNIAHQWRQPLSSISTASTGAKIQKEMGTLSDEQLISSLKTINNSAQYLSYTIEDFRDFFNPTNTKISKFNISDAIQRTLNILTAQYSAKNIQIVEDIQDITLSSIENELIQVLVNILNNARDALMKTQEQQRIVFITTYKEDENLIIEIKDNANGIKEDIIDKIFEPYFTTKHKSQGTGIGLFMSQEIIRKRLNGIIEASNEKYIYENKHYKGAKFTISIPTNLTKEV